MDLEPQKPMGIMNSDIRLKYTPRDIGKRIKLEVEVPRKETTRNLNIITTPQSVLLEETSVQTSQKGLETTYSKVEPVVKGRNQIRIIQKLRELAIKTESGPKLMNADKVVDYSSKQDPYLDIGKNIVTLNADLIKLHTLIKEGDEKALPKK